MRDQVVDAFGELTGAPPALVVRAPGRVNLIGDHTDYNGGFVLPAAIEPATWLAATPRADRTVRLRSLEQGDATLNLDTLEPSSMWFDYVAGTIWALDQLPERGFDAVIGTSIPVGAGLSSSAALELATARLVTEYAGGSWDPVAAALAAQRAENDFVGMPCGIMDQLIVATAKRGSASLIDCRSLEWTIAAIPEDVTLVILDSGTRRRLVDSAYDDRRAACERVAKVLGIAALRDATMDMLDGIVLDGTDRRRAAHVIGENARTRTMATAISAGDAVTAGRLMNESHRSLRDDYEVSGPALDTITEIARAHPSCHGARMTGAGFAGCAVALVAAAEVNEFCADVEQRYLGATSVTATLYPTTATEGVTVL